MVLCELENTFQHCKKKATTLGEVAQVEAVGLNKDKNACNQADLFKGLDRSKVDKINELIDALNEKDR
ncbi:hypothetical protein ACJX0J_019986, partial [Zea mays]